MALDKLSAYSLLIQIHFFLSSNLNLNRVLIFFKLNSCDYPLVGVINGHDIL